MATRYSNWGRPRRARRQRSGHIASTAGRRQNRSSSPPFHRHREGLRQIPIGETIDHGFAPDAVASVSDFDWLRAAELIDGCRSLLASLDDYAHVTSRVLHQSYEYENDEPQLGYCGDVVADLLWQVRTALVPLSAMSWDREPQIRALEVSAECRAQQQQLTRARHVVRAIVHFLQDNEGNELPDVCPALWDLEHKIKNVIDGLEAVAAALPMPMRH